MRYTIYEDPLTHRFALVPLPAHFVDGDKLPIVAASPWFGSHEETVAALHELLNREEPEQGDGQAEAAQTDDSSSR
jgi:hypothetical protein